jgi:hypothetical protein
MEKLICCYGEINCFVRQSKKNKDHYIFNYECIFFQCTSKKVDKKKYTLIISVSFLLITKKNKNKNKINYFLIIRKCSRRNKFNDKGLISVHRSNKGYSSTYNTPSISCRLHAIYYFDVLALSLAG